MLHQFFGISIAVKTSKHMNKINKCIWLDAMQKMIAKYIRTISKLPYDGNSLEGGEIDAAGNTN